jgi:membrane-associated phospholipid phosphatase
MSNSNEMLLADRAKEGGWWHYAPEVLVNWDQNTFDAMVAQDKSSSLYWFADTMAHRWPGTLLILFVLAVLVLLTLKKSQKKSTAITDLIALLVIIGLGNMLSDELKSLFTRLKPHVDMDIPGKKQPLSFPSNHSFNTASILGFFFFYLKDIKTSTRTTAIILLTLIWVFTAWTRIYLGEHFPSDVIAGLFFGFTYGVYGAWLLFLIRKNMGKRSQG